MESPLENKKIPHTSDKHSVLHKNCYFYRKIHSNSNGSIEKAYTLSNGCPQKIKCSLREKIALHERFCDFHRKNSRKTAKKPEIHALK